MAAAGPAATMVVAAVTVAVATIAVAVTTVAVTVAMSSAMAVVVPATPGIAVIAVTIAVVPAGSSADVAGMDEPEERAFAQGVVMSHGSAGPCDRPVMRERRCRSEKDRCSGKCRQFTM
jgi:hypothetical protein